MKYYSTTDVEEIASFNPYVQQPQPNRHSYPRPDDEEEDEYTYEEYSACEEIQNVNEDEEASDSSVQSFDELDDPADQNTDPKTKSDMDEFIGNPNNSYNSIHAIIEHATSKNDQNFIINRCQIYKSKISHRPKGRKDCKICLKLYITYDEYCDAAREHMQRHPDYYPAEEGDPTPCPVPPYHT